MLHVLPLFAAADAEEIALTDLEVRSQAKLDALARELHKKQGVSVTRLLKPGNAAEEITALASKVKANLIVLGCSACLKAKREVANAVIQKTQIPVLAIPAGAVFIPGADLSYVQKAGQTEMYFVAGEPELLQSEGIRAACANAT